MFAPHYGNIFKEPEDCIPPTEIVLPEDTNHPNLNSLDYATRPLNVSLRIYKAWECLTLNKHNHVVIGTNKLSGRRRISTAWGFEDLQQNMTEDNACFRFRCKSLISKMQFVTENSLLVALHSGCLQLWSTYSEVRDPDNPYCLFLVGEKSRTLHPITCLDVDKTDNSKAVTGYRNGDIKFWDLSTADIFIINNYNFGHTDLVTCIDTSHKNSSIFATSSLDHSAFLWDARQIKPASSIYKNYDVSFKALAWSDPEVTESEHIIYLGDEVGFVHTVDTRMPNTFLNTKKYFEKGIRKIMPKRNHLAVIADMNTVKITSVIDQCLVYSNSDALDILRDCVWLSDSELLTVGFEGKMHKHIINSS